MCLNLDKSVLIYFLLAPLYNASLTLTVQKFIIVTYALFPESARRFMTPLNLARLSSAFAKYNGEIRGVSIELARAILLSSTQLRMRRV